MKCTNRAILIIFSLLLAATPCLASFDSGLKAYKKKDFGRAMKDFKADGSKNSCYNIAIMYYKGEGVKQDRREAVQWFRKAADLGHMNAQFILGTMYDKGEDLALDQGEAFRWYRKAAEQGHKQAQFNVGYMYTMGEGVKKDQKEAVIWLKKAAKQGHPEAQKILGVMGEKDGAI